MSDREGWSVRGWAIVFNKPDLVGDVFTKDTDLDLEDGARRGLYFEHGGDLAIGRRRIGTGSLHRRDEGVWCEGQIFLSGELGSAMKRLSRDGLLGFSTGSLSHLTARTPAGKFNFIKSWPAGEISLTCTPAMPPAASRVMMKRLPEGDELAALYRQMAWEREKQKLEDLFSDLERRGLL